MPIAKEAIDAFLNKVLAERPRFKGASPADLDLLIYNCTGSMYEEKTESRPHQLEGVAFALYMRRALLFYWMRLGKSKIAVDWASHLKRSRLAMGKGLIIAHAPISARDVWPTEIKKHSDLTYAMVASGPGSVDALVDALDSDVDLVILARSTIQSIFTDKRLSRKGAPKLYPAYDLLALAASYFDHVIIDEPHIYAADPYSLPFALIAALAENCKFRLGLTGTPIGRKIFDIWPQAYLVDEGAHLGRQYAFFEAAFSKRRKVPYGRGFELSFDRALMSKFQYKIDAFALSYAKDEVVSAPVNQSVVELTMSPDQRAMYNKTVDKLLKMRMDDTQEVENVFIQLRRIASGYLPFNDENGVGRMLYFKDSAKLAWLTEFVTEVPPNMQCLIFHEYVHTGELICEVLKKHKSTYAWLYGGTKDKSGELARFKSGKAQFLVANTATGGTAIDIPEADYLCFFESPCDPRVRAQAQARPMARGSRPLDVDDLICAPIEEKVLGFIKQGEDLLREVLRGNRKRIGDMLRAK